MNRITITAAVAWLLAVFLLWFMIRLDYHNPSWLEVATSKQTEGPSERAIGPPVPNPAALSCEASENRLRERVRIARQCSSDSDCTLFDFGYPIDCMTSVARSGITALRLEYRKYEESCQFRVYFDCPAEPMRRRAVCRKNLCAVSLEATDALEEKTLEYLGIGGS